LRAAARLATIVAVAWLGAGLLVASQQERLLFPGAWVLPDGPEHEAHLQVLAVEYGARRVDLTTSDGVPLLAWLYRPGPARPTVLYLGGNAMPIEASRRLALAADAAGYDLLALSPRGFPGSGGAPSADGFVRDARAAWDWLKGPGGVTLVVLHGRSMGGGAMAALAAEVEPDGLVLESTFTALDDIASENFPLFPTAWLLRHRYDTEAVLRDLDVPVLVAHSRSDEVVPFHHGATLSAFADVWLPIDGASHGVSPLLRDPGTTAAWSAWLGGLRDNPAP
jgi:pimeloyl-ACP methyl ester carboxylesterase